MFLMAGVVFHSKSLSRLRDDCSRVRDEVKRSLKICASWSASDRVQTIRSNLCTHDHDSAEGEEEDMSSRIRDLIQLYNEMSKDVVKVPGVHRAEQILTMSKSNQNGLPETPKDQFNHLCYVNIGFIPHISMKKICAANERLLQAPGSKLEKVRNKPIRGLYTGTRATGPSGSQQTEHYDSMTNSSADEILNLIRFMSQQGIPYVAKVEEKMAGNFPKFSRDTQKPLKKRLFVYRVKGEPIFLHALYDQWNSPPQLYLSNFHTQTFSRVWRSQPLIIGLCNLFVGGFDPGAGILARRVIRGKNQWALRCIETVISYAIQNARVAFALQNPAQVPVLAEYTARHFFIAILKEHFPTMDTCPGELRIQSIPEKPHKGKRKRCCHTGCSKKQCFECYNTGCSRPVCLMHHGFICFECCAGDFSTSGIPSKSEVKETRHKRCHVKGCKSKSKIVCGNQPCLKPICLKHGARICFRCLFLNSKLKNNICSSCIDLI